MLGVFVFALIGLRHMVVGDGFLAYPPGLAKWLILTIETAATLAIGATLAAAYLGGRPAAAARRESTGVTRRILYAQLLYGGCGIILVLASASGRFSCMRRCCAS